MTERLEYAMNVVRHLESVATTPELRAAFNAVQPKVSAFYSSLPLNEGLWKAIQHYASTAEARSLTGAMKRYLTKTIDSFKRHGADLPAEGKARLKEIDVALTEVTTKFSENVLDSTNAYELLIEDEKAACGIASRGSGRRARLRRIEGKPGWRFTLHGPSYIALMTYLDDSTIRQQVWHAYNTRATAEPHDNRSLLEKILELRQEKARLLGFRDFADLVLDDRMAHTGDAAQKFLDDLRVRTEPRFREENAALEAYAGQKLEPWDVGYWSEKQRAAL
jgi:oligopeptidase A